MTCFALASRSIAKVVSLLALATVIGAINVAAHPQTDSNTAQANQHYQNAVDAIADGDWQTAKNELLQAKRLAPQNALVHYDLALAYKHMGEIKTAQAELDKAIQIGLPADHKKAADGLKVQLSIQAAKRPSPYSNSNAVSFAESQATIRGALLVDTDDACFLALDDENKGLITPDREQRFSVSLGDHILKCIVPNAPDLVWRKAVSVKDSSQVAAVITLKALHIQYDQAIVKVKSQKDEEEGAAAKKLAEAEATQKAKADFPQQLFNQLSGRWSVEMPWQGPKGNPDVPENDTVTYAVKFDEIDATQGLILFTFEWEHLIFDAYNPFKVKGTAFGYSYKAGFSPTPTGRFQPVSHACVKAVWVHEGKGAFSGHRDWIPCAAVDEAFGPGTVTILSQNQIQMETGGLRLTLTRE